MNTYIYIWPRAFTSYCKALNETVHRIAGAPYIYTTDPLPDPPFTNVLEHYIYIYIYDRPFSGSPFWTAPQNRLFEFIGSKTLYIYTPDLPADPILEGSQRQVGQTSPNSIVWSDPLPQTNNQRSRKCPVRVP